MWRETSKKKIRLFGDKNCEECIQMKNKVENADIIVLDDNVEIEILLIEEEPGKTEWENVMKRTGAYFVPHIEVTWEGNVIKDELHLSHVRDFQSVEEGFEKLQTILSKDYNTKPINDLDYVEINEKLKSLTFMQEILYKKMQSSLTNFTNIRDFINIPGSKIEL